jgi:hypothetical protein
MTFLRSPNGHLGIFGVGMFSFVIGTFFVLPSAFATTYRGVAAADVAADALPAKPSVAHQALPGVVKGIYMSQCVVGTPSFRDSLVTFVNDTELNTIVIDIKDYTGYISFPTDEPLLTDSVSKACGAHDMAEFVKGLHAHGIYVIGRITVFQDPRYAKLHPEQSVQSKSRPGEPWKDNKGLSFIDPSAKPYWDYVVELSKYAYLNIGFDELNYDYIRWPSDGPMSDVVYPNGERAEAIEKFWQYLSANVKSTGATISADLFGYTTVLTDDLGIGQQLERALPYFDYIDPMVYPSHYNKGFAGLKNVNSDPYKVVNVSLNDAVERTLATTTSVAALAEKVITQSIVIPATATSATTTEEKPTGFYTKQSYPASKIRPWLQSFDYPIVYTADMVAAQIKANNDAGLQSYLVWDAANKYNALRKVLAATSTEN